MVPAVKRASWSLPLVAMTALTSLPAAAAPVSHMIVTDPWRLSVAGIVAAAWLAVAVWAIIRGGRSRVRARLAEDWGLRLRGLLATTPNGYLIVGAGGRVTCSDTLRSWLAIDHKVTRLDELNQQDDSGLRDDDFNRLALDIDALAMSGTTFTRLVANARGDRLLLAQGRLAPAEVAGEAGVVVWFIDATDSEQALGQLQRERDQLAHDLEAATAMLEAAPFPIWRRDGDLKLRHVNTAYVKAVEAHGAAEAVVRGMELVNNALSTAPAKAAQRARDLGASQIREEHVIIDGKRRTLQITDVPLGDAGIGGFALDITEAEDVRAELNRYAQAQNATLDRLSSGVVIFAADTSLTFYNKAFATLFGLDTAWLNGHPDMAEVLEELRQARRLPEQRDFPDWKRRHLAWFTEAFVAQEETWVLPDETVLRVIAQPHPFGGLLLVFEDRTEQLTLESSRNTLIKVQEATLNHLSEAVAVFGSAGHLQLYNQRFAELWKLSPEFLDEQPHVDAFADVSAARLEDFDDARRLREGVLQATDGRQALSGRLRLRGDRVFDFAAVPLPDGNALVTFLDVTASTNIEEALRDRNEALEAADQLKSQFVANMSYELRTPLTSIIGFAEMLEQEYFGPLTERQREYVASILTSSNRLLVLINDILDLAVTEAGALELDIGPVVIEPMVTAVIAMVEEQARGRSLILTSLVEPDAGTVDGDERRLKQVLYNLLSNAIRFTPPGGSVSVIATGDDQEVAIEVLDTGVGILDEEQDTVFDRFRRGSNAGPATGVGLGLSLVRQFVTLHGGTVALNSRVNEGTRVVVRLPRHVPVATPARSA